MMPVKILRAIPFAIALLSSGCYYDIEEELYPDSFCDTENVTWTADVQPLISSNCAISGCHVSGAQTPDLSTYAAVKVAADAGAILARAINADPSPMPPTGLLPNCDRQALKAWLEAGAPNN